MSLKPLLRILKILYFGTYLIKIHLTSYIASIINGALWFILILVPAMTFSEDVSKAFTIFLPGVLVLMSCGVAVAAAIEFLRWYVNQGLTDMFRECGLNVFSYLLSGVHIDTFIFGLLSYMLIGAASSYYVGLKPSAIIPLRPLYFMASLLTIIPAYLLIGSMTAYIYTVTRISSAWMLLAQMILTIGTLVPPSTSVNPLIYLINPATLASELARAAYGSNVVDESILIVLALPLSVIYIIIAYLLGVRSDRYISRYGLEYRY